MSSSGYSYSPSPQVCSAHGIPHLNTNLQKTSPNFDFSIDYVLSLLPFGVLLAGVSFILMIGYIFGICFAALTRCCRAAYCPSRPLSPERPSFSEKIYKKVSRHERFVRLFLCSLASLLITNGFIWYGNYQAGIAFG